MCERCEPNSRSMSALACYRELIGRGRLSDVPTNQPSEFLDRGAKTGHKSGAALVQSFGTGTRVVSERLLVRFRDTLWD
jgi:hypothetical protein